MTPDPKSNVGETKKPDDSPKNRKKNSLPGSPKSSIDWRTVRRLGSLTISLASLSELQRKMKNQETKISWSSLKRESEQITLPSGLKVSHLWSEEIGQYQSKPISRKARRYRDYLESPNRVVPGFRRNLRASCEYHGLRLLEYNCGAYEIVPLQQKSEKPS